MRILQKKGFQLLNQGQVIGKTSYLQTRGCRKLKKVKAERKTEGFTDARLSRAWEKLPDAKREKILRQAGSRPQVKNFKNYEETRREVPEPTRVQHDRNFADMVQVQGANGVKRILVRQSVNHWNQEGGEEEEKKDGFSKIEGGNIPKKVFEVQKESGRKEEEREPKKRKLEKKIPAMVLAAAAAKSEEGGKDEVPRTETEDRQVPHYAEQRTEHYIGQKQEAPKEAFTYENKRLHFREEDGSIEASRLPDAKLLAEQNILPIRGMQPEPAGMDNTIYQEVLPDLSETPAPGDYKASEGFAEGAEPEAEIPFPEIPSAQENSTENVENLGKNRKLKRRIMRKLSRKMLYTQMASEGAREENGKQERQAVSEQLAQPVQKAAKMVINSIIRSLVTLAASFPPIAIFLFLCVFLLILLVAIFGVQQSSNAQATNLSPEVEAYRSTVADAAADYGMSEYVELLLALMMQESGGRGLDPMQASEGAYNTQYPRVPNGITDPQYSIECGIQELQAALTRAEVQSPTDMVNIRIALQGYNFGPGYITWFREKGYTEWSFATACEFAESTGWGKRSDPDNPAGPWNYGDQYYPEHVLRYYSLNGGTADLPENGLPIPIYYQWEYQQAYGSSTIAVSGCGPSCFAMVVSYLRDETITPADVVAWCGNTYYVPGAGTSWNFFASAAAHYEVGSVTETTNAEEVMNALREGRPVISSQVPGLFTGGGHFIVLRGITDDGKILVNDPNDNDSKQYLNRRFDMYSEIHCTSANYWIFEAKQEKVQDKGEERK